MKNSWWKVTRVKTGKPMKKNFRSEKNSNEHLLSLRKSLINKNLFYYIKKKAFYGVI